MSGSWSPGRMPRIRDQVAKTFGDPDSISVQALTGKAAGPKVAVARTSGAKPVEEPGPYNVGDDDPDADTRRLALLATHLRVSDLYWVTGPMSALAVSSAATLPEVNWAIDRPANFGLLVWDEGIGRVNLGPLSVPIRAASWGSHPDGIAICLFMSRADIVDILEERSPGLDVTPVMPDYPPLMPVHSFAFPIGEWVTVDEFGDWRTPLTILYSSWVLMQQPKISTRARPPVDRDIRQSYGRADRPQPDVTLIDLRRLYIPQQPREADPDAPGRVYRHRWVVSGHWRNQPYGPGRADRRKQWIPDYIKGPDGAELLDTARVNVWRR